MDSLMGGLMGNMPDELYAEDLRQSVMVLSSARDLLMRERGTSPSGRYPLNWTLEEIIAHTDTLIANDIDPERLSRAVDFLNAIGMQFGMLEGLARANAGNQTTETET